MRTKLLPCECNALVALVAEHERRARRIVLEQVSGEVERRADDLVDLTWWRKDRDPGSVFVDYNQNARDHTIASAYSVRGTPEGVVSAPLHWDEIADADPKDFTIATMPARFAEMGDLHADIDDHPHRLDQLLEWADRDERDHKVAPADAE